MASDRSSTQLTTVLILVVAAVLAFVGFTWGMRHARPADVVADVPTQGVIADVNVSGDLGTISPVEGAEAEELAGLNPELSARFDTASQQASAEGIALTITSGRRTPARQQELIDQALIRYESEAEAHRWVLPPEASAHVNGTAIDVGPTEGAMWLGERQEEFGLCRTYLNEMWHFELTGAIGDPCPQPYEDASHGWS